MNKLVFYTLQRHTLKWQCWQDCASLSVREETKRKLVWYKLNRCVAHQVTVLAFRKPVASVDTGFSNYLTLIDHICGTERLASVLLPILMASLSQ
jgi:transposase